MLAVVTAAAIMAVAGLHVSSGYYAPDHAAAADARVITLDDADLQRAANLYRAVP